MTTHTAPAGLPSFSKQALALTKNMNVIISAILRSPFHRILSRQFILLSFHGRKSGKKYTLPVGYLYNDDVIEIISPRSWWKNLTGENTSVSVLLQRKWHAGSAQVFHGDETVVAGYLRAMKNHPSLIHMYHVAVDSSGQPEYASVQQATREASVIHIRLLGEKNT